MSFPERPGDQTRQDDSAEWQPLPCTQAIPQDVCKWLWGAETPRPSLQALSGSSGPSCPRHLLAESLTSLGLSCPHVRQSWIKPVLTRSVGSQLSLRSMCPEWLPASGQVLPPLQAQFPPTEARGKSHQLSRDPMEAKRGRPSGDVCQPIH